MSSSVIQELLDILDLEPLEVNLFRGRSPQSRWQRVYGGQVIGQALVAACRTVDEVAQRPPHSLHAYFLLGGDPKVPIIYEVERIRDGRSFTTRRVTAIQHGRAIFSMEVSFHGAEEGLSHQFPMPDVPKPELAAERDRDQAAHAASARPNRCAATISANGRSRCGPSNTAAISASRLRADRFHVWIRATGRLPDEPAIHQCVLAYASDMSLLGAALIPHGRSLFSDEFMAASLDHAMWFHRPFRADEWMLYVQDSPSLAGSRGFTRGEIFASDGTLVASVAQEGLLRQRRPKPK